MNTQILSQLFFNTLSSFNIDKVLIENYWQNLINLYNEPHRHYHNLSHIMAMVDKFLVIKNHITDKNAVILAIFYHDCIYHCQKQEISNELLSANYFENAFKHKLPNELIDKVKTFIIATEKHTLLSDDRLSDDSDLGYFLDLDLSILGADWDNYQSYCHNIAKEYAYINPLLYKAGRAKVLSQFLIKPRIYYSEYFYQTYEQMARQNIKKELKTLL